MTLPMFTVTLLLCIAADALAAVDPGEVIDSHPRLLIRAEGGGDKRIVTLEMIRNRAEDPRFDQFERRLNRSPVNHAMRALAYGDSAAADEAIAMLLTPLQYTNTTWDGIRVMWAAFVFDWLYTHPNFDDWEKAVAVDQIVTGARHLEELMRDRHLFHTRMYAWTVGLAAAGYALKGHFAGAADFIRFAEHYFAESLLPGRRLLGGSVHNGFGYGRHYIMWLTGHYLSMVYSATGRDLWSEIRDDQEDWAANEARFIIQARQPDGLMAKFGDCYRRTSERFSFRVIAERHWHYHDPVFQGYLNFLLEEQPESVFEIGNDYIAYLYYDPDAPVAPVTELPTRSLFGRHGTGFAIWRSGWGRDDTWIIFKAGDYFGNHGHYDQGHVGIFRSEPLLPEAGAYTGGFSGQNHRMDFYRKSVAHNTILITDPTVPDDEGGQRIYMNQTLGSFDEYNADLGAEMADIIAYDDSNPSCSYLLADLSAGYPRDRVQRVTRELALVDNHFLIVRDQVTLARSGFLPKVLWHCPVEPALSADGFQLVRGKGKVSLQLLEVGDRRLTWVEGHRVGGRLWEMTRVPENSDPCLGRVELTGSTDSLEQEFIQVLDITGREEEIGRAGISRRDQDFIEIELPSGRTLRLDGPGAELR